MFATSCEDWWRDFESCRSEVHEHYFSRQLPRSCFFGIRTITEKHTRTGSCQPHLFFQDMHKLCNLTEEAFVFVPVRSFDSAVMHVAARNSLVTRKSRVQETACVITSEVLQRCTEKREQELNCHLGSFFSAFEQLKGDGLLRTTTFLVDNRHLDVLHNAIKRNDHVYKGRVFLDSVDVNGSCPELSARVSRSQVDLLSLNSLPHGPGIQKPISSQPHHKNQFVFFAFS